MVNNILITSAGRRVSLLQSFQHALKHNAIDGLVFAADSNPDLSAACHVADRSFDLPAIAEQNYIEVLLALCKANSVKLVIPTIDTELQILSAARDTFIDHGIDVVVSEPLLIDQCMDKTITQELFNSIGLQTPALYSLESIQYPCFAKPKAGSNSRGLHVIEHEDAWPPNVKLNSDYMLCEYLDQKAYSEYTVDMFYNRAGTLVCLVPRLRLAVRAGEINKGLTVKADFLPELRRIGNRLEGARGCITLQVFVNNETRALKGIEINPRFGGGYPLSDRAGATYARWLVEEALMDREIHYFDEWTDNLLMLRYDEAVYSNDHTVAS